MLSQRKTLSVEATVRADGKILIGESVDDTPSTAAKAAMGRAKRVGGWNRWRVPRLSWSLLADIKNADKIREAVVGPRAMSDDQTPLTLKVSVSGNAGSS